jgi:hypothetical protein
MLRGTVLQVSNKSKAQRIAKASEVKVDEASAVAEVWARDSNKAKEPNAGSGVAVVLK